MTKTRLCIVTTTRADWGLLMPLAGALRETPSVDLQIVAANMHLMEEYGMTVDEIVGAGFTVDARVPMRVDGDDEASRVRAMGVCMAEIADAFEALRPDAAILLGDRYEMLAIASAAAVMRIPIVHIAGGEISEGAIDDAIRHAITKLATLHLTATEPYRQRVIQMGENPERVVNTGAIGVWNAFNTPLMSAEELSANLGIDLTSKPVAVVTFHPATNDTSSTSGEQMQALLDALDRFENLNTIITYPNNDAGGSDLIAMIEGYAAAHPERVRAVRSLGMVRYQSLLQIASAVIGNSSSGIVEAPSAGAPTVDIGIRQRGRLAADSVIHCGTDTDSIAKAIAKALSPEMQALAAKKENPYYKPDTLQIMTDTIVRFAECLPVEPKKFYDIPR